MGRVVIEEGMRIDASNGVVLGRFLEPDKYNVYSAPLFIYNRSDRFYLLCRGHMCGSERQVSHVLYLFRQLEDVWEDQKDKYKPRKYFLSQKLLCLELCKICSYKCSIISAIQDKSRLRAQMLIYDDLFLSIKPKKWQPASTLANKQNSINLDRAPNYLLVEDTLPRTPSETLDQLTILALQWHSNLV